MRRQFVRPHQVKSGDLIVAADGERMRVTHLTRFSDDVVIVHGDTVHGPKGKAHSVDRDVTRLD